MTNIMTRTITLFCVCDVFDCSVFKSIFFPYFTLSYEVIISYYYVGSGNVLRTNQWWIQDFPEGGAANPKQGHQPIIRQNVCQKMHENKRNWTERDVRPRRPFPWIYHCKWLFFIRRKPKVLIHKRKF